MQSETEPILAMFMNPEVTRQIQSSRDSRQLLDYLTKNHGLKPEMLDKLKKGFHCFMDNLSGDILSYDKETQEWYSMGNIGLHDSRAEASLQGLTVGGAADTLKKKKTHQSNSSGSLKPVLIMTSDSDIKCELRKNFMSHWLFKGIYHEFIVENVNTWDPHPINITNIETI